MTNDSMKHRLVPRQVPEETTELDPLTPEARGSIVEQAKYAIEQAVTMCKPHCDPAFIAATAMMIDGRGYEGLAHGLGLTDELDTTEMITEVWAQIIREALPDQKSEVDLSNADNLLTTAWQEASDEGKAAFASRFATELTSYNERHAKQVGELRRAWDNADPEARLSFYRERSAAVDRCLAAVDK